MIVDDRYGDHLGILDMMVSIYFGVDGKNTLKIMEEDEK
jgi:hypothetical protein